jgi:SWI/SNF-related matrix-associated actin-dependent regulator of chromatin subfamily A-like protein 1
VIGLTGTPIVNRPIEAFNILRIIDKTAIPNFYEYTRRFCEARYNGFGWDYSGASNTEELHNILMSSIVIRRRKEDVLPSLPPKIRSFVPLELDNRKNYDAAEDDFITYIEEAEGKEAALKAKQAPALVKISKLRMLAAEGKLEQAIDWIEDTIQDNKLVVFGVHRRMIDPVYEKFKKVAVKIAGDVSEAFRQQAIDRFQNDPKCKLFVGQIQAAGTGITLTAASHVAFLELPWTSGDVLQCEDRVHRIGQFQPVIIYYLLAANTIDEDMAEIIDRKRKILDAVLDGSPNASPSIITELLKLYRKRIAAR